MKAYKIFTVSSSLVTEGTSVGKFTLKGAEVTIPAILVGESGRGRKLGVLPVQLPQKLYKEWEKENKVEVFFAEVGQTKAGRPKLFVREREDTDEKIIAVLRTQIGYRGSNRHTGDRTGEVEEVSGRQRLKFHPFPGKMLIEGRIAQGIAGRMGSGEQMIALMSKNQIFRTGYSGRLYGGTSAHYYLWDGENLLSATWEEREVSDIF
jgi:hypothetical protein